MFDFLIASLKIGFENSFFIDLDLANGGKIGVY